jgi:DNA (cytosine-5)-methyltransferase 1
MPDFDILIASFPCQSFSMIGKRLGLQDEKDDKGSMIFQVLRILKARRPRAFILENVKGLLTAERGQSFRTIQDAFRAAGYSFHWKVIQGTDCGIPQRRPRLFMVGFRDENPDFGTFSFPEPIGKLKYTMSDVFGGRQCEKEVGHTILTGRNITPITSKYNWMRYWVDGVDCRVGPLEMKRMMNFPDNFTFVDGTSETQITKQLGNAVIPAVVKFVAESVIKHLSIDS